METYIFPNQTLFGADAPGAQAFVEAVKDVASTAWCGYAASAATCVLVVPGPLADRQAIGDLALRLGGQHALPESRRYVVPPARLAAFEGALGAELAGRTGLSVRDPEGTLGVALVSLIIPAVLADTADHIAARHGAILTQVIR